MDQAVYGGRKGRKSELRESADMLVVRAREGASVLRALHTRHSRRLFRQCREEARFPDAGVAVLRAPVKTKKARDEVRAQFKTEKALQFAGRVLQDRRSGRPVVYTENLFVKFGDGQAPSRCKKLIGEASLKVKRALPYSRNAWFVEAKEGTGTEVFALARGLLRLPEVECCHPELARPVRRRRAYARQWHLKKTRVDGRTVNAHARVVDAWRYTRGQGITIAVIDDGIDWRHPEFRGAGKVVSPRDVTRGKNTARPVFVDDNHGTACAGVACASGRHGASGVAPAASLLPIRSASGLGTQQEADAIRWAVDKGADVISCSWGPEDGDPEDRHDALHDQVHDLPDSTRLALEYAITHGRGGKGCVITWAAGNGNERVDNDGYASFDKVIAVAACNDRGRRSTYSDHGKAILCAFPSNDFGPPEPLTPGIWTTDRREGAGYNPNEGGGDAGGQFTEDFGGTSSACPGVAGVAALVLAVNPALRWDEVRDVLARSCDRIDRNGGRYNSRGRSRKYGFGRLNARRAVQRARALVEG